MFNSTSNEATNRKPNIPNKARKITVIKHQIHINSCFHFSLHSSTEVFPTHLTQQSVEIIELSKKKGAMDLVSVVTGLVGAVHGHTDVLGLVGRQLSELDA